MNQQAAGIPAHNNQGSAWDHGERFDVARPTRRTADPRPRAHHFATWIGSPA